MGVARPFCLEGLCSSNCLKMQCLMEVKAQGYTTCRQCNAQATLVQTFPSVQELLKHACEHA